MKIAIAWMLTALLLASCSIPGEMNRLRDKLLQLGAGDRQEEVLNTVGDPGATAARGDLEVWQYCATDIGEDLYANIWFENGRIRSIISGKQERDDFLCPGSFPPVDWNSVPDQGVVLIAE